MSIHIGQVIALPNLGDYKLHLATRNDEGVEPLDVFARDRRAWDGWTAYRGRKADWKKPRVFTLLKFYPILNTWLFGGIYEVLAAHPHPTPYELCLLPLHDCFIGRLLVSFHRGNDTPPRRAHDLGRFWPKFAVHSILQAPYSGAHFPGYENINHPFSQLEVVYRNCAAEWERPLRSVAGVYVIHDTSNGKKYVGSAYSQVGTIWERWGNYLANGHGGNVDLTPLIDREGIDYARRNFVFSVLEIRAKNSDVKIILEREAHWRKVLLAGGQFGYN